MFWSANCTSRVSISYFWHRQFFIGGFLVLVFSNRHPLALAIFSYMEMIQSWPVNYICQVSKFHVSTYLNNKKLIKMRIVVSYSFQGEQWDHQKSNQHKLKINRIFYVATLSKLKNCRELVSSPSKMAETS